MNESRIPGFYRLSIDARRDELCRRLALTAEERRGLTEADLDVETADQMIENVICTYALPMGLGLNFVVNDRPYIVPMCIEEPSVVAAASNAARMVQQGGGFTAALDEALMIGQVQIVEVPDTEAASTALLGASVELVDYANRAVPNLVRRGGGVRRLQVRVLQPSSRQEPGMLVVHLLVDCGDAMGANIVNTVVESVRDLLVAGTGGRAGLAILSNLADSRLVRVSCRVPPAALASDYRSGVEVRDGIVSASRFAEADVYRAATHNKGIMNGIDAVLLATGNDWRGVEAGAHCYASRSSRYSPLAVWRTGHDGQLEGFLELPMAVGTVGGGLRVHPRARLALKILRVSRAAELAAVVASAGLASNLAALRALAGEGIQRGHMSLHRRALAPGIGAGVVMLSPAGRASAAPSSVPDRSSAATSPELEP
jgi:hydroxymethylglutaryl-CoA reductase